VADITCVPIAEGWLFVAAVMHLYSRQILRWSVWDSLEAGGALQVLNRTLVKRRYPARPGTTPSLHHSITPSLATASLRPASISHRKPPPDSVQPQVAFPGRAGSV
jgi:hypothetical protein